MNDVTRLDLTNFRFVATPIGVEVFCTRHHGADGYYQATEIVDDLAQALQFAEGHEAANHAEER